MKTRTIVYGGVFAALYAVLTVAIAPLSYGPIQLRMSNLIKPIALFDPAFAISLAIGTGMANLFSPFGPWDWAVMPLVEVVAALVCWSLRRWPVLAVVVQSLVVSVGVCLFPLGFGAHLPFAATFIPVALPNVAIPLAGYLVIWKRFNPLAYAATPTGERQSI